MKQIIVGVFPAEGINSMELHDALSYCVNVKVIGLTSIERHGKYIYSNYISRLPKITDSNFISIFNQYIEKENIDIIFPTHDDVVEFLANHAEEIACKVMTSDLYTAEVTRSKIKTWELFSDKQFVPERYYEFKKGICQFLKPDKGQGAVGSRVIRCENDLEHVDLTKNLLTEYLPGHEYTVDCLTDNDGMLRSVTFRSRERINAGVTDKGTVIDCPEDVKSIAKCINERLKFLGLWYFQLKEDARGQLKLMEISARCAGTMCLTRATGINLPLLSVYTAMGYPIKVVENNYKVTLDRGIQNIYSLDFTWSKVYMDFDDTVTLRGKVNLKAIYFLYQCKSQGKQVYLLTKHKYNIRETLEQYSISETLFKKILIIEDSTKKSNAIKEQGLDNAIFIDNMYKEREEVARECGIPVFDADQIEVLLDWKI